MTYSPADWYWIVAGSTTQVWSSARVEYVPQTDATYEAWLAAGNLPTRIDTAANLAAVLLAQWAPLAMAAGLAIVSTGTPALSATYAIDAASQATIVALSTGIAAGKPLPGGGATFNYPDMTGAQHAFTGPEFLNFAAGIEGFIYNVNQALIALVSGVAASLPTQPVTIA